ncbi:MAG TPA: hypothetical protein PKJ56_07195, partial [Promineifilum sp.]|nr:hypothetical protein [Promineifilum sp.]
NYGVSNVKLDLTSSWQTFELEFTTTGFAAPTTDTRLRLWLTPGAAGTVYDFDEVILMKK